MLPPLAPPTPSGEPPAAMIADSPPLLPPGPRSRGELVLDALGSHPLAEPYRGHIEPIRTHLAQLTAAENERSALYLAEGSAEIARRAALDEGIRFHAGLRTPLMVLFKDDEDEVNSYIG